MSYAYSRGRGNTATGQAAQSNSQFLDDLNLDTEVGPTTVDRPHILTVSGSYDVPRTGGLKLSGVFTARSGTPFSLIDTTFDHDRNGLTANEYLPAGTYLRVGDKDYTVDYKGGRNGGRGPNFQRLDLRAGYRSAWALAARSTCSSMCSTRRTSRTSRPRERPAHDGGRSCSHHVDERREPDADGADEFPLRLLRRARRFARAGGVRRRRSFSRGRRRRATEAQRLRATCLCAGSESRAALVLFTRLEGLPPAPHRWRGGGNRARDNHQQQRH